MATFTWSIAQLERNTTEPSTVTGLPWVAEA